jgi:hypothetical protein
MRSAGWLPDALGPSMSASSSAVAQIDRLSLPELASPPIVRAMKNTGLWTVPALVVTLSMFGVGLGCGESGGGTAGSGGAGGSGGAAGSTSPVITEVRWTWPEGDDCKVGMTGAVTISVSATDAEQLSLDYTGSVSDCTPDPFDGNVTDISILDCDPVAVDYTGTVTVTDPEANSDTVTFEFRPCNSGKVCEGGDPCE